MSIGITVLLAWNILCLESTILEDFQNACPYTNFCTTPSLKKLNTSDDVTPCCYDCFCDDDCWAHGDCCPDLDPNKTSSIGLSTLLECKPAYHENSYLNSLEHPAEVYLNSADHLRIVDFCSENYSPDHVIHKNCLGQYEAVPDYDDVVLVSDGKFRIFKNRHCALCHGVSDPVRWNMIADHCKDEISEIPLKLSETKNYFMNNCVLKFERPPWVPLNGRTLSCTRPFMSCGECGADQDVITGCNNGPYMPYYYVIYKDIAQVYKNVMCFKCYNNVTNICPDLEPNPRRISRSTYKIVLNQHINKNAVGSLKQSGCREDELYDPYKEECRQLYCPPFEAVSHGRCIKISNEISNLHLRVQVYFTFDNGTTIDRNIELPTFYNESMGKDYFRSMVRGFSFFNCEIYSYEAFAILDSVSKRYIAIAAYFHFKITESCTMQVMSKIVKKNENKNTTISWLLNGKLHDTIGHISFFDMSAFTDTQYPRDYLLLQNLQARRRISPVNNFFLCPYFILELGEYKRRIEQNGAGNQVKDSSKFFFTTRTYPGFYALSDSQVVVCLDTYLPSNGATALFWSKFIIIPTFFFH